MSEMLAVLRAGAAEQALSSANSETFLYLQVLFVLVLVSGLALVVLRVGLPRLAGMRKLVSGAIRVEARYALEPKKNLYIVRIGPDYYLVGTTESGMQCLTALDAAHVEAALSEAEASPSNEMPEFVRFFRRHKTSS
jgi:flagellar biogenesis protein FliO